jgi:simple sugar transport system permease protein
MDKVFALATLTAGIRLALPVALAALGALCAERSGVLNLGVEGSMLGGALAAYLVADVTGSPWVGLLAGAAAGALAGVVLAAGVIVLRANQIVTGLAFTLLASALTTFIFQQSYDIGARPPRIDRISIWVLAALVLAVFAAVWFLLERTSWGLALTSAGEAPEAVDALGYPVNGIRAVAVVGGNALVGLGGAVLVCGPLGLFIQNVTAGRGWIALALVVFARWRPSVCLVGAALFGLCDAVQLRLQGTDTAIPYEVFLALPYVVTLLAMVVRARDSRTPSALGTPFVRGAA